MKEILITILILSFVWIVLAQNNKTEDLPKILFIGDSISIGYTPFVKKLLKDKAIVEHHEGNAEHTGTGLQKLDEWLGDTRWDVIHFNWGLWDLCYRHPESEVQGNRDKEKGKLTTTLEQYEKNLDLLVIHLKKTGAKLVWAHTSLVPEGEAGRIVGDDIKYNKAATRVMKKHNVVINDLYKLTKDFPAELFTEYGNVHYTKEGYRQIALKVADEIVAIIDK